MKPITAGEISLSTQCSHCVADLSDELIAAAFRGLTCEDRPRVRCPECGCWSEVEIVTYTTVTPLHDGELPQTWWCTTQSGGVAHRTTTNPERGIDKTMCGAAVFRGLSGDWMLTAQHPRIRECRRCRRAAEFR